MRRRAFVLILSMLFVGTIFIRPIQGKEYPAQPIEIYCPFSPGTSSDATSRLVAAIAGKHLSQPMVVVNKAGAGGSLVAAEIIRSKPDGYKLAMLANIFFAITAHTLKITFDPSDLIPITNFMEYKLGFVVSTNSPWKTLADVLDYGRNNPGKIRWAHAGRGTSLFMNGLFILRKAGVEAVDVPYTSTPDVQGALLGGHLELSASPYGGYRGLLRAGKVKFLVMFNDRRYSDPSDVPSAPEVGFPEAAKLPTVIGLYAHRNTPPEIIKKLSDVFKKVYGDPEFKIGLEKWGEEPRFGGPEFMKEAIKRCEEVGVPMLKEFGLYVGK